MDAWPIPIAGARPHASLMELRAVFAYDRVRPLVVEDVSVGFEKGQVTSIVGPNGCGKSTLLRLALRLRARNAARLCSTVGPCANTPRGSALDDWRCFRRASSAGDDRGVSGRVRAFSVSERARRLPKADRDAVERAMDRRMWRVFARATWRIFPAASGSVRLSP